MSLSPKWQVVCHNEAEHLHKTGGDLPMHVEDQEGEMQSKLDWTPCLLRMLEIQVRGRQRSRWEKVWAEHGWRSDSEEAGRREPGEVGVGRVCSQTPRHGVQWCRPSARGGIMFSKCGRNACKLCSWQIQQCL